MKNRGTQKLAAVLVLSLLMIGLIAGNSVNNAQNTTNLTENNISQNDSVLVPIDSFNVSANDSLNETTNLTNVTIANYSHPEINTTQNNESNISSVNSNADYKPIESVTTQVQKTQTNNSEKKIKVSLVENNKVQVEGALPESFNINNIQKQDIQENGSSQQVIVSSPVHVTDPLTVYADIPEISPSQKSSVKIFWKNENKSITPTGFYDTNSDGLYDRVSWIVPHLSTQIFQISVTPQTDNTSGNFITITGPQGETISNPLKLNITANYSYSTIYCNLKVFNASYNSQTNFTVINNIPQTSSSIMVPNGDYNWNASCEDTDNSSIEGNSQGYFTVNQIYSVSDPSPLYLINGSNYLTGTQNTTIAINKESTTKPDVYLYINGQLRYHENNYDNSTLNLKPSINYYGAGSYVLNITFPGEPTISKPFSVAQINVTLPKGAYTYNNTAISVSVKSTSYNGLAGYVINFGNGNSTAYTTITPTATFQKTFNNVYNSVGSPIIQFTYFFKNGNNYQISGNLMKTISVKSSNDTSGPTIDLISPANNQVISLSSITFSYRATDSSGIKNCTTDIYYYKNGYGSLNYSRTDTPTSGTAINIPLIDFSPGTYSWDVKCYDTKGNFRDYDPNGGGDDFTVSYNQTLTNYAQKSGIQGALDALDNFTKEMGSYSLDQIQALDDLGLATNISTYFPKRLAQIKQFFETNQSAMISNPTQRQKAISENNNDLAYISAHIPTDITISNQEEFTKNSMSSNMENIVQAYMNSKDISLRSSEIRFLAQQNMNIQKYLNVFTNARQVTIDYANTTQEVTLVTEQLNISNGSIGNIIIVLPSGVDNVTFLVPTTKLATSIYEISTDQIQNGEIIYYLPKSVQPSALKQSDTILFQNFAVKSSGITGFIPFISGSGMSSWYYLVIFLVIVGLVYGGIKFKGKADLDKWKKEENVERIMQDIERAKMALREDNDTEAAKEAYHRIKELFVLVPEGFREYATREITMIRKGIDRRDIIGFVKEYEKAKYQGREDDAKRLYQQIKMTYKRLPKKDQEKIYDKLFRRTFDY